MSGVTIRPSGGSSDDQKQKSGRRAQEPGRKVESKEDYPKIKKTGYPGYPSGSKQGSHASDENASTAYSRSALKRRKEQVKRRRKEKRKRAFATETRHLVIMSIFLVAISVLQIIYQISPMDSAKGSGWDESINEVVWVMKEIRAPNLVLKNVMDYRQSPPRVAIMGNFQRCNQLSKATLMYQLTSSIGNALELAMYCGQAMLGTQESEQYGRTIVSVDTDQTTNITGFAFSGDGSGVDIVHMVAKNISEEQYEYGNRTFEMVKFDCEKLENGRQSGLMNAEMERFCQFHDETLEAHKNTVREARLDEIMKFYNVSISETVKEAWLDFTTTSELDTHKVVPRRLDFFGKAFQIVRPTGPALSFVSEYMIRATIKCINETRPWLDHDLIVPLCFAEAQKSAWIRLDDGSLRDKLTVGEEDELAETDAQIVKKKYNEDKLEDQRKIPTIVAQPAACSILNAMQYTRNEHGSVFRQSGVLCIHVKSSSPKSYAYAAPLFFYDKNQCKIAIATSGGFRSVASSAAIVLTSLFSDNFNQEVLFPILDITGEPRWIIDNLVANRDVKRLSEKLGSTIVGLDLTDKYKNMTSDRRKELLPTDPDYFEAYVIYATSIRMEMPKDEKTIYVQRCFGCIVSDQMGF